MEFIIGCILYLKLTLVIFMTLAFAYFTLWCHRIYGEKREYGTATILDFLAVPFFSTITLLFLWGAVNRFLAII